MDPAGNGYGGNSAAQAAREQCRTRSAGKGWCGAQLPVQHSTAPGAAPSRGIRALPDFWERGEAGGRPPKGSVRSTTSFLNRTAVLSTVTELRL